MLCIEAGTVRFDRNGDVTVFKAGIPGIDGAQGIADFLVADGGLTEVFDGMGFLF